MSGRKMFEGSEIVCRILDDLGVDVVFGIPGTQNTELYRSLHKSRLRAITPTSELAASFMANGYYRSSGRTAVLTTIPGPGFTYALSGIAEAYLDSVAMLCITGAPEKINEMKYQHQAIEQDKMIMPVVKSSYKVRNVSELASTLEMAFYEASSGEPGPVYVEIEKKVYKETAIYNGLHQKPETNASSKNKSTLIDEAVERICSSQKVLFYLGQGAQSSAGELKKIIEWKNSPVLTTSSGRGAISEDHKLLFPLNTVVRGGGNMVNQMIDTADLVVAIGTKFSFNGSGAFSMKIPKGKLIHVDSSQEVLNANYPASVAIQCSAGEFCDFLISKIDTDSTQVQRWPEEEITQWKDKVGKEITIEKSEEVALVDAPNTSFFDFFNFLQNILPSNSIITTDSGQHQLLARRYLKIKSPRGLIIPANFQSMGFAIPAALGTKLANPDSTVIAIIGDGGFNISGLELLSGIRDKIDIKVVILNDNSFGLIKSNQYEESGKSYSTKVLTPDYKLFAESIGSSYIKYTLKEKERFSKYFLQHETSIVEVVINNSAFSYKRMARRLVRSKAKSIWKKIKALR